MLELEVPLSQSTNLSLTHKNIHENCTTSHQTENGDKLWYRL